MKKYSIYLIIPIILLSQSLLVSCVDKQISTVEKYYDTEIRKESYLVTEQYEISSANISCLYTNDSTAEAAILFNRIDSMSFTWALMTLSSDYPSINTIIIQENAKNPRLVLKTNGGCIKNKGRKSNDYKLIKVNLDFTATVQRIYPSLTTAQIESALLEIALGYDQVEGKVFNNNDVVFTLNELFQYEPWALIHIYKGPIKIDYVWDKVTIGTHEVTKYKYVPYLVQKEKNVFKTVTVPFWENFNSK